MIIIVTNFIFMGGIMNNFEQNDSISYTTQKKNTILRIVLILGGVILVLGVLSVSIYWMFGREIKQTLLGPTKYYTSLEGENLKKGTAKISDNIFNASETKNSMDNFTTTSDFSAKIGDLSALNMQNNDLQMIKDIINKLSFSLKSSTKNGISSNSMSIKSEGKAAVTADMFFDGKDVVFQVSDLYEKYLSINLEKALSGNVSVDVSKITLPKNIKFNVTNEQLSASFEKYVEIYLKTIQDINNVRIEKNQTYDVGSTISECDKIIVTLTEKEITNIIKEMLEKSKDDETLFQFAYDICSFSTGESYKLTKDEYKKQIDSAIEFLNKNNDTTNNKIEIIMLVNKRQQVVGRYIKLFEKSDEILNVGYKYKINGSNILGEATLTAKGTEIKVQLNMQYANKKFSGNVKLDGKIDSKSMSINCDFKDVFTTHKTGEIDLSNGILNFTFDSNMPEIKDINKYKIQMVFKGENKVQDCNFTLKDLKDNNMCDLIIKSTYSNSEDVKMPELNSNNSIDLYSDPNALSDIFSNDEQVQIKLASILEKLGLNGLVMNSSVNQVE